MGTSDDTATGGRVGEIVRAALKLLDESGLDAVTLRAVAGRLGVRLNTVSWHVKSKARLRDLMADAVLADIDLDDLPEDWRERTAVLVRRYRQALLAHRDGARVVTGTFAAEPATLAAADAVVTALLDGGLADHAAGWTCWTLIYFTLGLTQEEQSRPEDTAETLRSALGAGGYRSLLQVLPHLADGDFDSRFEFGVDLILKSAATRGLERPQLAVELRSLRN
ncbi:MAG: Tetracyclin repressor protein [Amycolatopsis sp.]|uniref:TetR/AcrR family transcriptional regulator n=1 Tax=Amycolatopsis sp. TaxID=37632 RepID=UPI00262FDAEB|nr:TetR/AcrR family transcriptional regulator [Amycolatopsis sp.]MCU1686989.1 Tetracyclin repressor protein [Amycolatopsis sp.]